MDILVIYQFCSFGGVERVLLNRAMAFKSQKCNITMHAGYLQDFGALDSFKGYIRNNHLDNDLIPFLMPGDFSFSKKRYDIILIIDTPQILDKASSEPNVFIECHTPYIENRQYLREIPQNIKGIIVPSASFRSLLQSEFHGLPDISVLPNPVPGLFYETKRTQKVFGKRPVTYLARIDALKNFYEAVQIFESIKEYEDLFLMVIGQGETVDQKLSLLEQKNLVGNTFLRAKISFDDVPTLTNLVRQNRGIFISPSRGESFGLSVAEFICGKVPVLISDIPAHQELVNDDERFLYPIGDICSAKKKLTSILNDWDSMSISIAAYGEKFKYSSFINNWLLFLNEYGYNME